MEGELDVEIGGESLDRTVELGVFEEITDARLEMGIPIQDVEFTFLEWPGLLENKAGWSVMVVDRETWQMRLLIPHCPFGVEPWYWRTTEKVGNGCVFGRVNMKERTLDGMPASLIPSIDPG